MGIEDFTADSKSKGTLDKFRARLGGSSSECPPAYSRIDPEDMKPDELKKLQGYDTVFVLDDSFSMSWSIDQSVADAQCEAMNKDKTFRGYVEKSRWEVASEALASLVQDAARYDKDGIDIYFLNDPSVGKGLMSVYDATVLLRGVRPNGATPIGGKLNSILFPYLQALEKSMGLKRDDPDRPKPLNIVVITDGSATDKEVLRETIVKATKLLEQFHCPFSQVGIQFVQIGCDKEAERFLKELDDDLTKGWWSSKRASRDIVDTIVCTGTSDFSAGLLAKILTGGIDRRLDSQSKDTAKKGQLCY